MAAETCSAAGRLCRECRNGSGSRMRTSVRHLHELPECARFWVEGGDGAVLSVVERTSKSVRVASSDGRGWRRMAPTTLVVPVPAGV